MNLRNISIALTYREALRRVMNPQEFIEMCVPMFSRPGGNRDYIDHSETTFFATYKSLIDPPTSVVEIAEISPTKTFLIMLEHLENDMNRIDGRNFQTIEMDLQSDYPTGNPPRMRALFNYYARIAPFKGYVPTDNFTLTKFIF